MRSFDGTPTLTTSTTPVISGNAAEWICTICAYRFTLETDTHPACPNCPPNRLCSRIESEAGQVALARTAPTSEVLSPFSARLEATDSTAMLDQAMKAADVGVVDLVSHADNEGLCPGCDSPLQDATPFCSKCAKRALAPDSLAEGLATGKVNAGWEDRPCGTCGNFECLHKTRLHRVVEAWRQMRGTDAPAEVETPQPKVQDAPAVESVNARNPIFEYNAFALSKSRLETLTACPRRFYIEYEAGMEYIGDDPMHMRMGVQFARAIELNNPKAPFKECYAQLMSDATSQEETDALFIESCIVEFYASKYIEIYGLPLQREVKFEYPIGVGDWTFRGAIDGMEMRGGVLLPVENKLYSRWSETKDKSLSLDLQVSGNVEGAHRIGATESWDTIYRVCLKPQLRRKKGRGKNPTPETVPEFVGRIMEAVNAEPEKYFLETIVPRTPDDIAKFYADVQAYAMEIEWRRTTGNYPRAKDTCNIYEGGCAHRQLCEGLKSAMTLYRKKEGYPNNGNG